MTIDENKIRQEAEHFFRLSGGNPDYIIGCIRDALRQREHMNVLYEEMHETMKMCRHIMTKFYTMQFDEAYKKSQEKQNEPTTQD